jgi:hypothetical protein
MFSIEDRLHIINKLLEQSTEDAIRILQGLRPLLDLISFTKVSLGHSARSGMLDRRAYGNAEHRLHIVQLAVGQVIYIK